MRFGTIVERLWEVLSLKNILGKACMTTNVSLYAVFQTNLLTDEQTRVYTGPYISCAREKEKLDTMYGLNCKYETRLWERAVCGFGEGVYEY